MNKENNNGVEELNTQIIIDYINRNNLTVKEFCRGSGISKTVYYSIMKGNNFNLISLFRIAKHMDLPIWKFFDK